VWIHVHVDTAQLLFGQAILAIVNHHQTSFPSSPEHSFSSHRGSHNTRSPSILENSLPNSPQTPPPDRRPHHDHHHHRRRRHHDHHHPLRPRRRYGPSRPSRPRRRQGPWPDLLGALLRRRGPVLCRPRGAVLRPGPRGPDPGAPGRPRRGRAAAAPARPPGPPPAARLLCRYRSCPAPAEPAERPVLRERRCLVLPASSLPPRPRFRARASWAFPLGIFIEFQEGLALEEEEEEDGWRF
ncbi:hypothetical protein BJ166DRAFT_619554, partial [Pestalotiopsis sp. NC0098]